MIDLGHNHTARIIWNKDETEIEAIIEEHLNEKGEPCGGFVPIEEGEWRVIDPEPEHFTISPSIDCTECEAHGCIINGSWHVAIYVPPEERDPEDTIERRYEDLRAARGDTSERSTVMRGDVVPGA